MEFQGEFELLCRILDKNRIRHVRLSKSEVEADVLQNELDMLSSAGKIIADRFEELKQGTVYKLRDEFVCSFKLMLLDLKEHELFAIGPYLDEPVNDETIREIMEQASISPQKAAYLREYYLAIPVFSEGEGILSMLDAFAERIYKLDAVKHCDFLNTPKEQNDHLSQSMHDLAPEDTLTIMKAIERRYEYENELMRAVSRGKRDLENRFAGAFDSSFLEKRNKSPLRNGQNYCIIMNTLLRKAAENGGVHPIYLDKTSSEFAKKIEGFSDVREIGSFMKEMFLAYCKLVRRERSKFFSPIVKECIRIIESDLSADIAPGKLASMLEVSLGYLSGIFKRDTGKTVSQYIRECRMEYAEYLLAHSELQIQTVALHCGIVDVQYFSKLFKKQFGKTPSEYREQKRSHLASDK